MGASCLDEGRHHTVECIGSKSCLRREEEESRQMPANFRRGMRAARKTFDAANLFAELMKINSLKRLGNSVI